MSWGAFLRAVKPPAPGETRSRYCLTGAVFAIGMTAVCSIPYFRFRMSMVGDAEANHQELANLVRPMMTGVIACVFPIGFALGDIFEVPSFRTVGVFLLVCAVALGLFVLNLILYTM